MAAGTVPGRDDLARAEPTRPRSATSVAKYRGWEDELFAGTDAGQQLPININEYAFNYHTSVPGQMIQWISAIEESKVDADIAYWNIDGNLSDSAVQANRGNGQWWLLNAYGQMSGAHRQGRPPPHPSADYTLQGVATLDKDKKQARAALRRRRAASATSPSTTSPTTSSATRVHAAVREIPLDAARSATPPSRDGSPRPNVDGRATARSSSTSAPAACRAQRESSRTRSS